MSSINSVVLVGRLTRAPELRITPTGVSVATVTLAVDRRPSGDGSKEADFVDVVFFSKLAEIVCKYQDKGSMIGVEGRIQTRSFETKDGQKRKVFEIVADNVQFLTPKAKEQTEESQDNYE